MASDVIKKGILYIKELQDLGVFGVMTHPRLNAAFLASPFYYVVLPMMGGLLSMLALLDAYDLAKASNKNLDKWAQFGVSLCCAVLSNISIFGLLLAASSGATFAAAPWLFLSSVLLGAGYQFVMANIDIFRALMSSQDSRLQKHFIQSAVNHLFLTTLMAAISGCVTFIMLTPVVPVLGNAFAAITVSLVGVSLLWRLIPPTWKAGLKKLVSVDKPTIEPIIKIQEPINSNIPVNKLEVPINYAPFFTQKDYVSDVGAKDFNSGKSYLLTLIENKIKAYDPANPNHPNKIKDKIAVLCCVASSIQQSQSVTKSELIKQYPQAFQSFWLQTGEVEAIVDAAVFLTNRDDLKESNCLNSYAGLKSL